MFATTHKEAKNASAVMTSTRPIIGHHARVLFDSSPTHSIIFASFVKSKLI